MTGSKALL